MDFKKMWYNLRDTVKNKSFYGSDDVKVGACEILMIMLDLENDQIQGSEQEEDNDEDVQGF